MHKPDGIFRALLLALVLATGAAIVWGFAWGCVANLIEARQRAVRLRQTSYEQFDVLQDGTPVITISNIGYSGRIVRTLEGELRGVGNPLRGASLLPLSHRDRIGRLMDWRYRVLGCSDFGTPPAFWYLVHDGRREGQAWFEGFDSVTGQRIGWIGREGFRREPPTAGGTFTVDGRALSMVAIVGRTNQGSPLWDTTVADSSVAGGGRRQVPPWMIYLVSAGRLLEIDLRQHSVRTVLEDAELISAGIVEPARGEDEPRADAGAPMGFPAEYLAACGRDRVWIIAPGTGERREFPLPHELRDRYLGVYLLQDGLLLTATDWPLYNTAPIDVIWLNEQGEIARRQAVTLNRPDLRPMRGWLGKVGAVVIVPIPVLLGLIVVLFQPLEEVIQGTAATYFEALATSVREYGWLVPPVALLAFGLAAWCARRHRRYGQSGGGVWFVFVLLLGLPGLAGYLLHRRWPVLQACPACGRAVPRDRTACSVCGAEFPRPAARGNEVFVERPSRIELWGENKTAQDE